VLTHGTHQSYIGRHDDRLRTFWHKLVGIRCRLVDSGDGESRGQEMFDDEIE